MLNIISMLVLTFGFSAAQPDTTSRIVLTDVENNIYEDDWYITSLNLTPECESPWYVKKYTLHGGMQEGMHG